MADAALKSCSVAYATPERQFLWTVHVPTSACIADVIDAAREIALRQDPEAAARIPWDGAPVGIFGEACGRDERPRDGDRVELYRSLQHDPRGRRREQVKKARAARLRRSRA